MTLTCPSFAKINLFLYVTGKRNDGYHELCTLMTPIDLHDEITFDFNSADLQITCDHPDVPEDDSNLVIRAARLFYKTLKDKGVPQRSNLSLTINKRIPPGGGLGGGSSNAAVVLKILNEQYDNLLDHNTLMALGLKLGADVPFFIQGQPAVATGVGERLKTIDRLKGYYLVLCDPGVAASTVAVYKNIDFGLTIGQKDNIRSGLNMPLRGQEFDAGEQLHNDLEESACRLYPKIKQVKQEMSLLLGKTVNMTGSGASLFTLYTTLEEAEDGVGCLKEHWAGSEKQIFLSSFNLKH